MLQIYRAHSLVTSNPQHDVIDDAFLAVENGRIRDLGPWKKRPRASGKTRSREVDFSYGLIAPTLSNLHAHLPMVLFRGIAEDQDLFTWLQQTIFPLEGKFLNPDFVRLGTELGLCESIRNGVTNFCNMYLFGEEVAKVADRFGVRGVFCQDISNFKSPDFDSPQAMAEAIRKLVRKYRHHPRIQGGVSPHSVYGANLETLKMAASLAKEEDCGGMIHLSETVRENEEAQKNFQRSPLRQIEASGLLDARFLILAHSVHIDEDDFNRLKSPNLTCALNVQCNAKLASGVPPVAKFKKHGIRFALGTDGAASNNNLDIFEEMNFLGKVHHLTTQELSGLRCEEIFDAATIRAAEALGQGQDLGSLEVGKQADFMVLDLRSPHMVPMTKAYSYLVYSARGADVDSVYVSGKALMKNRKLLVADESKIMARSQAQWKRMKSWAESQRKAS